LSLQEGVIKGRPTASFLICHS